LNVPISKVPTLLQPALWAFGLAAIALIVFLLWRRRLDFGPTEIFLIAVAGILAIWPFRDPRFWLPAMPILLGLAAWAIQSASRPAIWRPFAPAAVGFFVVLGLAGLAYNTRLSLSGDEFPKMFVDDYLGPVYREAWGLRNPADSTRVDSTALHVLRRFEPRAHPP
jgi:hypothetical protein